MPQVDVITGEKRHRRWTLAEKQAIVAAAFVPGAKPMDVARQVDISSGQLYTWRKELIESGVMVASPAPAGFFELLPTPEAAGPAAPAPATKPQKASRVRPTAMIELRIGETLVRLPSSIRPELASAILAALVTR